MPEGLLSIEQTLTLLREGPSRIAAITSDLSPAQLRTSPIPGEWSATDMLAHLRSCADVWGSCIAVMLAEYMPTLKAVNPTHWIKSTNYRDLEFRPSLEAYAVQRIDLLAVLEPLPPEAWSRAATVKGAGKPLTRTVWFYAQWIARHERSHFKHLKKIVNGLQV